METPQKPVIFHEEINLYYNFLVALTDCFQPIKCKSNSDEISQMERVKNLQVVLGETGKLSLTTTTGPESSSRTTLKSSRCSNC
jgi:hypothetical protein